MATTTAETLTTTWTSTGPLTHTVTTPRNTGETNDAWTARHAASVAALKAIYPPIG